MGPADNTFERFPKGLIKGFNDGKQIRPFCWDQIVIGLRRDNGALRHFYEFGVDPDADIRRFTGRLAFILRLKLPQLGRKNVVGAQSDGLPAHGYDFVGILKGLDQQPLNHFRRGIRPSGVGKILQFNLALAQGDPGRV